MWRCSPMSLHTGWWSQPGLQPSLGYKASYCHAWMIKFTTLTIFKYMVQSFQMVLHNDETHVSDNFVWQNWSSAYQWRLLLAASLCIFSKLLLLVFGMRSYCIAQGHLEPKGSNHPLSFTLGHKNCLVTCYFVKLYNCMSYIFRSVWGWKSHVGCEVWYAFLVLSLLFAKWNSFSPLNYFSATSIILFEKGQF